MYDYVEINGSRIHWPRRGDGGRHFTPDDWNKGRNTGTGTGARERWVFPNNSQNRTKELWPYSYSDHYLWGKGEGEKNVHGTYSDRLSQQAGDKYKAAFQKVNGKDGCGFRGWTAAQCSEFLTMFFGRKTECVGLSEGCNVSSGYPYWVFYYKQRAARKKKA